MTYFPTNWRAQLRWAKAFTLHPLAAAIHAVLYCGA
jgi:hypothetical protein